LQEATSLFGAVELNDKAEGVVRAVVFALDGEEEPRMLLPLSVQDGTGSAISTSGLFANLEKLAPRFAKAKDIVIVVAVFGGPTPSILHDLRVIVHKEITGVRVEKRGAFFDDLDDEIQNTPFVCVGHGRGRCL